MGACHCRTSVGIEIKNSNQNGAKISQRITNYSEPGGLSEKAVRILIDL